MELHLVHFNTAYGANISEAVQVSILANIISSKKLDCFMNRKNCLYFKNSTVFGIVSKKNN